MEHFKVSIEFSAEDVEDAKHLFKAFTTCIADHVPYHATLKGNVPMVIVNDYRMDVRKETKRDGVGA